MYIYAYLNNEDICIAVYDLPAPVHDPQYIQIAFADQSLVGQYFDRSQSEFKVVYYYAELDEKMIVTRTLFYLSPAPTSEFFRSITFNQYLTVKGLYWNGTDYVTPPIHIQAVCSTDQVNYKNEDIWLTTILERMSGETADLELSVQNLVTANAQNAIDIQNLQAADTEQNAEIARANQEVEDVRISVNDLDGRLCEYVSVVNSHTSRIGALESEMITAESDIAINKQRIDSLETATETISNSVGTIANAVESVSSSVAEIEGRVTENSERIESMSMDIYHLYETSHIYDDSIATLKSDVTAAKNSVNGLSSRLNETDADIANIEGEISDLEGEVAGVITKANTNASSISALATRTTNVENRVTAVERRATTLESSVATNKTNITNLTTKVNDNTSSIAGVKADLNKYLPLTGGSLTGDLDVNGVLRMEGSQAFYYNVDAQTMNIGTNNAKVVNFGGVHSGGVSYFNSATLRPYSVVPRNSDSLLGNSTYRWKGIYSQSSVNVSSDERLKSDIKPLDKESLAAFIQALEVVKYKYIGCDEKRIGLIAQKVIEADPKLAKFFVNQSSDGYYNLKPADFVFPLIAAVQELKREIDELRNEIRK